MHLLLRQTKEKTDDENETNELQSVVTQSNEPLNLTSTNYSRLAKISDGQITRRKYFTNKAKSIQKPKASTIL